MTVPPPPDTGAAAASPPPSTEPSQPAPARPPLRRLREGKLLGGVAAGLAAHLGLDVAIVRILVVVVTVITDGLGLVAYLLALVFVPAASPAEEVAIRAEEARRSRGRVDRDPLFWVGVGLLVLGALWFFTGAGGGVFRPTNLFGRDLLWPLVLIGFGLALWRASDRSTGAPPPSGGSMGPTPWNPPAATPWGPSASAPSAASPASVRWTPDAPVRETTMSADDTRPLDRGGVTAPPRTGDPDAGWTSAGSTSAWQPPAGDAGNPPPVPPVGYGPGGGSGWTPPPVPDRERSLLGRVTIGLALVIAGVLWILREADVLRLGGVRIVAAALLVVGVGLLVGSVVGRGRGLIAVGLLLLPVVIVAELLRPFGIADPGEFAVRRGAGEIQVRAVSLDDLDPSYQLGAGPVLLDLSQLTIDEPTTISVQVGAGEIDVRLPADVTTQVTARNGAGEIRMDLPERRSRSGIGNSMSAGADLGAGSELLELELQVGLGEIRVRVPDDLDGFEPGPGFDEGGVVEEFFEEEVGEEEFSEDEVFEGDVSDGGVVEGDASASARPARLVAVVPVGVAGPVPTWR